MSGKIKTIKFSNGEKGEDDEGTMPVPDVRGKTYSEAVTLLNDSGFEVRTYPFTALEETP